MSFPLSKVGLTFHELKSIWRCGQVLNSSWVKANNGHSLGHNITEARRNKQGFDLPHETSLNRLLQVSLFVNNEQAAASPGSALHMKKEDGRGRQDDDFPKSSETVPWSKGPYASGGIKDLDLRVLPSIAPFLSTFLHTSLHSHLSSVLSGH